METNLARQLTDLEQTDLELNAPVAARADRPQLKLVAQPPRVGSRSRVRARLRRLGVSREAYRVFRVY
ncbi:MAG: hypothetical protein KDI32_06785 [Pseudomonadales bacterium]|nr:hypothetical protein [Pseudomonadales bacterium]